jgi:amphi-Trp domain-containing protein
MKNDNSIFRHESLQDKETIAKLMESVQRGLSKGTLKFSDDENEITLKPSGLLNLVIEASGSNELNVLDVRITWQGDQSGKMKKALKVTAG